MLLQHIKRHICPSTKSNRFSMRREKASGKQWATFWNRSTRIPSSLRKSEAVACFGLTTKHDYLQSHLYITGLTDTDVCPFVTTACSWFKSTSAPALLFLTLFLYVFLVMHSVIIFVVPPWLVIDLWPNGPGTGIG